MPLWAGARKPDVGPGLQRGGHSSGSGCFAPGMGTHAIACACRDNHELQFSGCRDKLVVIEKGAREKIELVPVRSKTSGAGSVLRKL